MAQYKLSPSDLTFLWDECPRCFYLKVARNFPRPQTPFPSIFTRIDGLMKEYFEGRPAQELAPELPAGFVRFGDRWVQSADIRMPAQVSTCYLRGKFDTVVEFEGGSYGVVDFKTAEPKPEHAEFYGRQLHAYAYALEHPAPGKFCLAPITRLGLLVVEPNAMDRLPDGRIAYLGAVSWIEIPYSEASFLDFLSGVLAMLDAPEPPEPAERCTWCQYRERVRAVPY